MSDPYLYPGTDIRVNKEGIRDRDALEEFERIMTTQRASEGLPGVAISADGLRALRAFLEILGESAGHRIDLTRIDPERWQQASIRGFQQQDYAVMRDVIAGTIVRAS
jgi:fido (protein-threonine AMPylation protein)